MPQLRTAIFGLPRSGGATSRAYDPKGMEQAKAVLPAGVIYCNDAYDCAAGADAAVIVTEWNIFRALDLDRVKAAMAAPVLVDLRNVYRAEQVRAKGFLCRCRSRCSSSGRQAETTARADPSLHTIACSGRGDDWAQSVAHPSL
jgi:hypothetical protein